MVYFHTGEEIILKCDQLDGLIEGIEFVKNKNLAEAPDGNPNKNRQGIPQFVHLKTYQEKIEMDKKK